jgi:hypothetical protein
LAMADLYAVTIATLAQYKARYIRAGDVARL